MPSSRSSVDFVANHASVDVVAHRNCVESQNATEVVEKKKPLSYVARLNAADVVENAFPWLSAKNADALVVEKKLFCVFQKSAEVVENSDAGFCDA